LKAIERVACTGAQRRKMFFFVTLLFWLTATQLSAHAQACRDHSEPMARLELIFGGNSPKGPIGTGYGQWRGRRGKISKEQSRILLILYQPNATSEARIEAIRSAYKTHFRQDSVMRIDGSSCVSF
jgi:hypothetical protein